jgi:hypothetical protein
MRRGQGRPFPRTTGRHLAASTSGAAPSEPPRPVRGEIQQLPCDGFVGRSVEAALQFRQRDERHDLAFPSPVYRRTLDPPRQVVACQARRSRPIGQEARQLGQEARFLEDVPECLLPQGRSFCDSAFREGDPIPAEGIDVPPGLVHPASKRLPRPKLGSRMPARSRARRSGRPGQGAPSRTSAGGPEATRLRWR